MAIPVGILATTAVAAAVVVAALLAAAVAAALELLAAIRVTALAAVLAVDFQGKKER